MQDIDFGKFYTREKKRAGVYTRFKNTKEVNTVGHVKKLSVFLLLFILAFTMGALGGIYISRDTAKVDDLEENYLKQRESGTEASEIQSKESKEKLISKNVPPPNSKQRLSSDKDQSQADELKHKLQQADGEKTYLVWAKTYANRTTAYRHGHFLKKQDLPVFLAKSGDKMKLYVGPVYGKNQAYQTLAKVKKWAPFKGAILHEKNN